MEKIAQSLGGDWSFSSEVRTNSSELSFHSSEVLFRSSEVSYPASVEIFRFLPDKSRFPRELRWSSVICQMKKVIKRICLTCFQKLSSLGKWNFQGRKRSFPRKETFLSTVGKFGHLVDSAPALGQAISLRPPTKKKGTPLMRSALYLVDGSVAVYRLCLRLLSKKCLV